MLTLQSGENFEFHMRIEPKLHRININIYIQLNKTELFYIILI